MPSIISLSKMEMKLRPYWAIPRVVLAGRAARVFPAASGGPGWMALLLSFVVLIADAQTAAAVGKIDFNRQIRPILSENCFQCHGFDPAERKGKLRLDIREEALKSAKSGRKAIVPGQPGQSELMARVTHLDPDELMPPGRTGKKLALEQIELLRQWVEQGAPYAAHWSYTKPLRPEVPSVQNPSWPRNELDHFVLARLEREAFSPMPEADRSTLIRRVALDLTGLPPTLAEVDDFLSDANPDAYGRLVDRFLQKDSYGEHWAQLWLDLSRYADSAGYADDPLRSIWGFRDYVIDAFNNNKPFDQFTLEQIAGDLLPEPSEEQLIATAFHRNTMTNSEGGTNDEEFRNAAVVDRVNTTLAVWMGTSIACAQCHNHKYDPISQEEYFRFFAFLNNTEDADRFDETPVLPFFTPVQKQRRKQLDEEIAKLNQMLSTPTPELLAQRAAWEHSFPSPISWQGIKPSQAKYAREAVLTAQEDGQVVHKGQVVDTYTVELPLSGKQISALRVEVLPHQNQARSGEGSAVAARTMISRFSAILTPSAAQSIGGRFVRVELPGKDKILSLAEVQVFGTQDNMASKGEASQSSTDSDGPAKLAIDGNTDGHFTNARSTTHTKISENPWWELDLKSHQDIRRIAIWNRTDSETSKRLSDFRVLVLNEKREVLWERKIKGPPMPRAEWAVDASRSLLFTSAFGDESGAGSDASAVFSEAAEPNKNGWVVPTSAGKTHSLTVLTDRTETYAEGAKLTVTFRVVGDGEPPRLMSFKLLAASEERLTPFAKTPGNIVRILSASAGAGNAADTKEVTSHFIRFVAPELQTERDQVAVASGELTAIKPNTVPIQRELAADKRRKTQIQFRGNYMSLGSEVTEGVPASFHPLAEGAPRNRLTLAKWLVDENNPLTARVVANRIWEQLFGIGIVRTSEEFGSQGEQPSNQELLDWLATELVAQRWDLKRFVKLLVSSATYKQTSKVTSELLERDPDNRLLARGPRFRITAEMVRDQALFLGGLLSPKVHGASVKPPRPNSGLSAAFGSSVDWKTSEGEDSFRRGLYTEWLRTSPYPSMSTFDAPNREVCTLRRNRTNTPLQALVTLNDPVYLQAAQGLAKRMIRSSSASADRIRHGFRLCLSRAPLESETARLLTLVDEAMASYAEDSQKADKTVAFGAISSVAEKDPKELAAWTTVANLLLNLDETVMKR